MTILSESEIEKAEQHLHNARHALETLQRRTRDLNSITSRPKVSICTENNPRKVYLYVPFEALEAELLREIDEARCKAANELAEVTEIIFPAQQPT